MLKLLPEDDPVEMKNIELNHGRLAMVAVMGVLGQEYATGVSIMQGLLQWIESALANPEDLPPIDGIF